MQTIFTTIFLLSITLLFTPKAFAVVPLYGATFSPADVIKISGSSLAKYHSNTEALNFRDFTPALNESGEVLVNKREGSIFIYNEQPPVPGGPVLRSFLIPLGYRLRDAPGGGLTFDNNGNVVAVADGPDFFRAVFLFHKSATNAQIPCDPNPPVQSPCEKQLAYNTAFGPDVVYSVSSPTVKPDGTIWAANWAFSRLTDPNDPDSAAFHHRAIIKKPMGLNSAIQVVDQLNSNDLNDNENFYGDPIMNNLGQVAYFKHTTSPAPIGVKEVINVDSSSVELPFQYGPDTLSDFCHLGVSINNVGDIAFAGERSVNGERQQIIFLKKVSTGQLTEVARTFAKGDVLSLESPFTQFGNPYVGGCSSHQVLVNDEGEVLVTAVRSNGENAIVKLAYNTKPQIVVTATDLPDSNGENAIISLEAGSWSSNGDFAFNAQIEGSNSVDSYLGHKPKAKFSVYQVVENPNLCNLHESSHVGCQGQDVDLVAGKEADVVIETEEVVVSGTMTLEGGQPRAPAHIERVGGITRLTFEFNPVPDFGTFPPIKELYIELTDFAGKVVSSKSLYVKIRRTNPIRIGFVKVEKPSVESPVPNDTAFFNTLFAGGEFSHELFPVSSNDYSYTPRYQPLPMKDSPYTLDDDRGRLTRLMNKGNGSGFFEAKITRVIGIVSDGYFAYQAQKKECTHPENPGRDENCDTGDSRPGVPSSFVMQNNPGAIPHEVGHTFCIRYDSAWGCDGIDHIKGHWFFLDTATLGYANIDISVPISTARGSVGFKQNLMYEKPGADGQTTWFSSHDYLSFFANNLERFRRQVNGLSAPRIYVAGKIDSGGFFQRHSAYLLDSDVEIPSSVDGTYVAEMKDLNRNLIGSVRFNSKVTLGSGEGAEEIEFALPIAYGAVYIDIYRDQGFRQAVGAVVIPADILADAADFIPNQAFLVNPTSGRDEINSAISIYRQQILNGDLKSASETLNRNLNMQLSKNLTDSFASQSYLDLGRNQLVELGAQSFVMLSAANGDSNQGAINPFVSLTQQGNLQVGERVTLRAEVLKRPSSSEKAFVYDTYFDGIKMNVTENGSHFEADSFLLTSGPHGWQVRTYLVDRRAWVSVTGAISDLKRQLFKLSQELESENDPSKKSQIEGKILQVQGQVSELKSALQELKSEVGTSVSLNFSVQ